MWGLPETLLCHSNENSSDVPHLQITFCKSELECSTLLLSEIEYHKLLLIGRLLSVLNLPVTVKTLFRIRTESFFDEKISSIGVF